MWQKKHRIGALLALFAFVLFVMCVSDEQTATQQQSSEEPIPDKIEAYTMCEQFVKRQLIAPSTAKFPRENIAALDKLATYQGEGRYRIVGAVDAQNQYGAMVRLYWECVIQYTDNGWKLISLRFEG